MTHEEELNKAAWQSAQEWKDDAKELFVAPYVRGFIAGAKWAEKNLSLTIEYIELLHTFLYAVKNNKSGCFTFTRLSDKQYQEVLKRFNEKRNDKI